MIMLMLIADDYDDVDVMIFDDNDYGLMLMLMLIDLDEDYADDYADDVDHYARSRYYQNVSEYIPHNINKINEGMIQRID